MRKIIKLKESEVFNVITKIINEETAGEITVSASNDLGTHPEFGGLLSLLGQLKKNVQAALRGKIPYRIKTDSQTGTVKPSKQGNALVLSVTLIPCEESQRHYFFDGAGGIYSYINTTSEKSVHSKVRTAVMNKATAGFAGAEPEEPYPNHINLRGFTGLNTVEPNKEYKLILKFLVGKRPGGYYDVGDDEPEQKIDNKTIDNTNKASTAATKQDGSNEPEKKVESKSEEPVSAEWEATDIDTAHKVKTFITDVQAQLEDMWKKGKNPIVEDIEMTIVKNSDGSYKTKTSATITESQDGKAWVGIESRGSAGGDYQNRANDQYYGGRYDDKGRPVIDKKTGKQLNKGQSEKKADGTDNPCYGKSLIDCMKLPAIGGDEVKLLKTVEDASIPFKQYFVIFTKPKKFPPR